MTKRRIQILYIVWQKQIKTLPYIVYFQFYIFVTWEVVEKVIRAESLSTLFVVYQISSKFPKNSQETQEKTTGGQA